MAKLWIMIAGLLGAGAVAIGAYHAHGLEDALEARFEQAVGEDDYLADDHRLFRERHDENKDGRLDAEEIESYVAYLLHICDVAVKYQFYHALGILGVGILLTRNRGFCWFLLNCAGLAMLLGVVGFSGGLYCTVFDITRLPVAIVPVGGLLMIVGWLLLAMGGLFVYITPRDEYD